MDTLKQLIEEAKKKAGTLSKEQVKALDDFLNNQEVNKLLNKHFLLDKDYTQKTQQLSEQRKDVEKTVQQLVDAKRAEIEATLKAEYTKKVQAVESLQQQLQAAWQTNTSQTSRTIGTLQQLLAKAEQDVRNVVQTAQNYEHGDVFLQRAGIQPTTSYMQMAQQAGIPVQPTQPFQPQFGWQPQPQPQGFQQGFNQGYQGYQGYQGFDPYQQGNQWQQQQPFNPFLPQQPQNGNGNNGNKPLSLDEILAKVEERYQPQVQLTAQLPFELMQISNEHVGLTGKPLDTNALLEKVREIQGAKPIKTVWEETYDIPKLRAEAQQKAEDERINKLVQERLEQERAKLTFPSEKQLNVQNIDGMFAGGVEGDEDAANARVYEKSYVNETLAELQKLRESRA